MKLKVTVEARRRDTVEVEGNSWDACVAAAHQKVSNRHGRGDLDLQPREFATVSVEVIDESIAQPEEPVSGVTRPLPSVVGAG